MSLTIGNKKVTDIRYGNKKVVKIYKGNTLVYSTLPLTPRYKEVEYVHLLTGQYIDTGIHCSENLSMLATLSPRNDTMCAVASQDGLIIYQSGTNAEQRITYVNNNGTKTTYSPVVATYVAKDGLFRTHYYNVNKKQWCELDGVIQKTPIDVSTYKMIDQGYPIYINTGPINIYKSEAYWKDVEIYVDGVKVYHIVPCIDTETNYYGFYDVLNKEFILDFAGHTNLAGGAIVENGRSYH